MYIVIYPIFYVRAGPSTKNSPEKSHYGVICNSEKMIYILLKHNPPPQHREAHRDTHISLWILGTSRIYKRLGRSLPRDHNTENMMPESEIACPTVHVQIIHMPEYS